MNANSPITQPGRTTRHFFDTNFFVLPAESLPKLSLDSNASRWITETTRQEVCEKLGEQSAHEVLDGKFQTLSFNDLYRESSGVCPVYYWFILSMYNPANVGNADFLEDRYHSILIHGELITKQDHKSYENYRRRAASGHQLAQDGKPKDQLLRYLERLQTSTSKKARKSVQDRQPAYLRDIRILSLILYSMLISRQDVVFYTTDGDAVPLLFKWLDSMSMRLALCSLLLPKIDPLGMQALDRGEPVEIFLNCEAFIRHKQGLLLNLFKERWKKNGTRITIRRWNQSQMCFEDDIWLSFSDQTTKGLSSMHGNFWCPFGTNNTHGNWLHINYFWPPEQPGTEIRIKVTKKPVVSKPSFTVSPEFHETVCKYPQQDASGEIASWSDFV
jgi:hypothetical protein